jgi:hypothetical protein
MKVVFKKTIARVAAGASLLGGCVAFDAPTGGADDGGVGTPTPHELRGELMLLVNGRWSDPAGGYQVGNTPLDDEGRYLGPELFLYDPLASCDGAEEGCGIVALGNLLLDERVGEQSILDDSLKKFSVRDLAWDPDLGLWGLGYEPKNDEWSFLRLEVPHPKMTANLVGVDRWVVRTSLSGEDPAGDPCYWYDNLTGLTFVQGQLFAGARGVGGVGLPTNGAVFTVDVGVTQEGHCLDENDFTMDPDYYACGNLCARWAQFEPRFGVAGDLDGTPDGSGVLAVGRSEDDTLAPRDRMTVYDVAGPDLDGLGEAIATDLTVDGLDPGLEMEGTARVGGRLFGINTLGVVYEIDEVGGEIRLWEDLGPRLPGYPDGVRLRGATSFLIED